jgi:peptidoglycan/xylan/chitin deacetylase (PgdA/CDA1 family)
MTFRRARSFLLSLAVLTAPPALACGPDALGTARTIAMDTTGGPRLGTKQYPATLTLADGEVVLTFDDGPAVGTTPRVLDALARECVKATFFLIGRHAQGLPQIAARTAREGHTIANHTWSHPWTIDRLSYEQGLAEIDHGAAAIRASAGTIAPIVRFPGFVSTPALLAELSRRNIAVFGTDIWASDWNVMAPEVELALVLRRLKARRKGIILFHDTREQTAAMIPAFLRELKARGYRVVHVTAR